MLARRRCAGRRAALGRGKATCDTSTSIFFFSSRRRHTRLQGDWSSDVCSSDLTRMLNLLKPTNLNLDVRLEGSTLLVQDLMKLEPGHILNFDYALSRPMALSVNGQNKYEGHLVATRNKKSFVVEKLTING